MKTVGLIGGMSWESTASYYQLLNETIKKEMGGLHSAKILLYSVDFAEIEEHQAKGEWDKSAKLLTEIAVKLEKAGADFIAICTNTMHKIAAQIAREISIPILHIADATAEKLIENKIEKVALLGTKYTMTQDFYKSRLIDKGIEVLIPTEADVEIVNDIIYEELCLGIISDNSRIEYQRVIDYLKKDGAEGVILGCTEIGLLIKPEHSSLPVFDTTLIHAEKIAYNMIK